MDTLLPFFRSFYLLSSSVCFATLLKRKKEEKNKKKNYTNDKNQTKPKNLKIKNKNKMNKQTIKDC